MIIVDDGSEDNTQTVIGQYRDSRIRYLKINHSGIFGFVRNQGIKIARGEFIAFLDSDDLWRHDKLEIQLVLLNTHANTMFIFSNIDIIGESSVRTRDYEKIFVGNVLVPVLEESRFVFYPSSLLFKIQVLEITGLLPGTRLRSWRPRA